MNEYRGFKVGDKVEITSGRLYPKGTITSFGDRKVGGCAEPDTMDVWISETTRFDMIYLVSHDLIKKLPNYTVGDVVREKLSGKIYEVTMVLGSETYRSGDVCFLEGSVAPFDGFRVGDTVWTVKRGKGVIRGMTTWSRKDTRSYAVFFDKDGWYYPRNTNLIPTEAKYKYLVEASKKPLVPSAEAWAKVADAFGKSLTAIEVAANLKKFSDACKKFPSGGVVYQCPKVDPLIPRRLLWYTDFVEPRKKPTYTRTAPGHLEIVDEEGCQKGYRVSKFAVGEIVSYAGCIRAVVDAIHWKDGKFTYDLRTNSCPDGVPEDSLIAVPAPKFKVGDAVYYMVQNHKYSPKRWVVKSVANECYHIETDDYPRSRTYVKESDLRLWKETVLTHCLQSDGVTWSDGGSGGWEKEWYKKIEIMHGYSCGDRAIFLVTTTSGQQAIFKGIKGDDIS